MTNNSTYVVQSVIKNFFNDYIYFTLKANTMTILNKRNGIYVFYPIVNSLKIPETKKTNLLKQIIINTKEIIKIENGTSLIVEICKKMPLWGIEYFYKKNQIIFSGK